MDRTSLINPVSLLGALLVGEGLLTQAQLIACLMIQKEEANSVPLGQITVRCGYVSEADLNRVLLMQQEVRSTLIDEIESHNQQPTDLSAVIMVTQRQQALKRYLLQLGVAVVLVAPEQEQRVDLVLVDQHSASTTAELPGAPLIGLLPSGSTGEQLLEWEQQLLSGYVDHAREQRRLRAEVEKEQQYAFLVQQFSALARRMSKSTTKEDMLLQLMTFVRDAISVEAGTLYQLDQEERELIFSIVMGPHQEELYHKRFSIDHGIAGWVARHNEPLLIPDVQKDTRFEQTFDKKTGFQTQSVLCVPMRANRTTLGVIQLINKISESFNEQDLLVMQIAAGVGTMVLMLDDTKLAVPSLAL